MEFEKQFPGSTSLFRKSASELVIASGRKFVAKENERYLERLLYLQNAGTIRNQFDDDVWRVHSNIKGASLDFRFDAENYESHAKKKVGLSAEDAKNTLKYYAIGVTGEYILDSIAQDIKTIKAFFVRYGDLNYVIDGDEQNSIEGFLEFIGLSKYATSQIIESIRIQKEKSGGQRELAHLINYLAIDEETSKLYTDPELPIEDFIYWFPIFFWNKVTFVIPLRATEMLVTPLVCIVHRNGKIYIRLRRSLLKGGDAEVFYHVDKDYRVYEYEVPNTLTIQTIEKYLVLTQNHHRRFLFDYDPAVCSNKIMSLSAFNRRLAEFIETHLVRNPDYEFAKYCAGISEFDFVTAGDSRPIAMANLFYQNVGGDICRQLAAHMYLKTSEKYYTNVSQTVLASSIMSIQRKINTQREDISEFKRKKSGNTSLACDDRCSSPYRPKKTGDITDCRKEDHLDECLGCRFYEATVDELEEELKKRKAELDKTSLQLVETVLGKDDAGAIDAAFLHAHTGIVRYRETCDMDIKRMAEEWEKSKNMTTSF